MEEIKVNIEAGVKELIIRQGKAPEVFPPKRIVISGQLNAPAQFLAKRLKEFYEKQAHLLFDLKARKLTLNVDEENQNGAQVIGTLNDNPDLEEFGINSKTYTKQQFLNMIRKRRMFFAERLEYDNLIKKLTNFQYSQQIKGEDTNDHRGNSKQLAQKATTQPLPESFVLHIPIFENTDPVNIKVDVLIDVSGADTLIWLESIELYEHQRVIAINLMEEAIATFKETEIVIIEV